MNHRSHSRRRFARQADSTDRKVGSFRAFRAAGVVLLLLTCLRIWTGPEPLIKQAHAQIPDAGRQRQLLVDETRKTNQLLAEIAQILRERTLNVRLAPADTKPGVPTLRPALP